MEVFMPPGMVVYVLLVSLVIFFAAISNFLVIGIVAYYRKLRTVTHLLICNLAVSDILLAVVYMPQKLHDMTHPDLYYEGIAQCKFIHSFPIFAITISCYTLVFISFERRRAIIESHKVQMGLKHAIKLLPGIWIGGFIVGIPTILEYSVYNINNTSNNLTSVCGHSSVEPMLTILNCLFVTLVSFAIPLVLMFNNYIKLIVFVNKRCSRISTLPGNDTRSTNQLSVSGIRNNKHHIQSFHLPKNRIKIVKMLVLMATTFVVCWLPFYALYVYAKLAGKDASVYSNGTTSLILTVLMAFSTAYNVILYVIFNSSFRQALKATALCSCKQINESSQISAVTVALGTQERRVKIIDVHRHPIITY